ncbi:MAG: hypothetical protein L0Z49_09200 [Actinobacteria bacterium]|nr:hypothetical protein [Actinomycetota bacterium]
MKKALLFVATFTLVLTTGVAVAFMTTPGGAEDEPQAIEKPTTTSSAVEDIEHETEPLAEPDEKTETEGPDEVTETEEKPDTEPPDLEILFPEDGQHFEEKTIAYEGVTEPGARVFAGNYEADVDEEGHWRIVLILSPGGNQTTFKAYDAAGNEATDTVKAFYDAPEEPKDDVSGEFTANQKFGSCSETPPYDVWYGTGEPGTTVYIASEYGSGSTVIGEGGHWDLKVHFFEMPCNQTIEVVLETDAGHRKVYDFTRVCEGGHDEGGGEGEDK